MVIFGVIFGRRHAQCSQCVIVLFAMSASSIRSSSSSWDEESCAAILHDLSLFEREGKPGRPSRPPPPPPPAVSKRAPPPPPPKSVAATTMESRASARTVKSHARTSRDHLLPYEVTPPRPRGPTEAEKKVRIIRCLTTCRLTLHSLAFDRWTN